LTVVDEKGLRLAREIRKAIRIREEDPELAAAIETYDRAVTPVERAAAASYLLIHSTTADTRYVAAVNLGILRMSAPELLPEDER
jgi:hypothetical protein